MVLLLITWAAVHRKLRWPLLTMIAAAPHPAASQSPAAQGPTVIEVSQTILREDVIRLGMNLGGESYYDSQQILRNLVSQNPGFEGGQWQTVLQCGAVTPTSCTDAANNGSWTEGFLDGGTFEVISGAAVGQTGTIQHSSAASGQIGTTIQFAAPNPKLAAKDFIVVRHLIPGHATEGWSEYVNGGATIKGEFKDLSPRTPGQQAVRISASRPGQYAGLSTFFDAATAHSYLQLRGPYVLRFRAKGVGGGKSLIVKVSRATPGSEDSLFQQTVQLSGDWQDYTLNFNAMESTRAVGSVGLAFSVGNAEVLLDDVSLEEATSNGTAFRNDVVATLQRLKPGVLRYMDSGENFGSSLDNMLAPAQARKRSGYNRYSTTTNQAAIGLHDFLVLCEKLGTQPWYSMQLGMSVKEGTNLMEYLGGPVTTKYGAVRAALGHPVPWTRTFPMIHLEYGNEAWNTAQPGASIDDPAIYAGRATTIFQAMRASKWYPDGHFNLIANGQAVWAGRTVQLLQTMQGADTIDIGPYNFNTFADDSSIEHIFGPMFAEPQFLDDSVNGYVHQQAHAAATGVHPVHLAVYETNIGTTEGTASQASINATVPSVGAGIASIEHELLMLRDLGVNRAEHLLVGRRHLSLQQYGGYGQERDLPDMGRCSRYGRPNQPRPPVVSRATTGEPGDPSNHAGNGDPRRRPHVEPAEES